MPLTVGVDSNLPRQPPNIERRVQPHVLLGSLVYDSTRLSAVYSQGETLVVQLEREGVTPAVPDHLVTAGGGGGGGVRG